MRPMLVAALVLVFAAFAAGADTSFPTEGGEGNGEYEFSDGQGAGGNVVYDNGNTDPNTDSGNEMTDWAQADDFELGANATLTGAECDWFITPGGSWDGTIEYTIYADAGGTPGAVVGSGTGLNANTTNLGNFNGWDWFTTSFDFSVPVNCAAGTRYWIAFHWTTSGCDFRFDCYLAYSTQQAYNTSQESGDCATGWVGVTSEDRAFKLYAGGPIATQQTTWGAIKSVYGE